MPVTRSAGSDLIVALCKAGWASQALLVYRDMMANAFGSAPGKGKRAPAGPAQPKAVKPSGTPPVRQKQAASLSVPLQHSGQGSQAGEPIFRAEEGLQHDVAWVSKRSKGTSGVSATELERRAGESMQELGLEREHESVNDSTSEQERRANGDEQESSNHPTELLRPRRRPSAARPAPASGGPVLGEARAQPSPRGTSKDPQAQAAQAPPQPPRRSSSRRGSRSSSHTSRQSVL